MGQQARVMPEESEEDPPSQRRLLLFLLLLSGFLGVKAQEDGDTGEPLPMPHKMSQ